MPINPDNLRQAMRKWATGVTVVTVQHGDVRHGMTVNSFTSISLTPPLVLVSLERTTRTHGLVQKAGIFGVTILSANQDEVSDCFAGRLTDREDRFFGIQTFNLSTGAPFIVGGLAFFDCRVVSLYEAGTHTLFIAEVVALQVAESDAPLIYFNQAYRRLA